MACAFGSLSLSCGDTAWRCEIVRGAFPGWSVNGSMGCSEADHIPVDIPSLPLGNRMMKQQQYPETVPFPAPSVVSATDIQSAAPLLDDERRQG